MSPSQYAVALNSHGSASSSDSPRMTLSASVNAQDWERDATNCCHSAAATPATDNAVANTPEQRDYRLQGMIANARVGDVSPVLSVVTLP